MHIYCISVVKTHIESSLIIHDRFTEAHFDSLTNEKTHTPSSIFGF